MTLPTTPTRDQLTTIVGLLTKRVRRSDERAAWAVQEASDAREALAIAEAALAAMVDEQYCLIAYIKDER